jgi:AcrR family transcriptional regulator
MSMRVGGRPIEVDVDGIGRIAVALFIERGFDAVTMDDIAAAGGVSRRTLFRYYPSKSDLVWGGFREYTEPVVEQLRIADPGDDPLAVLRSIYVSAAIIPEELVEVTRQRLLLIDSHPRLYADGQPALLVIRSEFVRFLDRGAVEGTSGLGGQVAAAAILAAGYAGFVWWAHHPDTELQETVDRALLEITPGSTSP